MSPSNDGSGEVESNTDSSDGDESSADANSDGEPQAASLGANSDGVVAIPAVGNGDGEAVSTSASIPVHASLPVVTLPPQQQIQLQQHYMQQALVGAHAALAAAALGSVTSAPNPTSNAAAFNPLVLNAALLLGSMNALTNSAASGQQLPSQQAVAANVGLSDAVGGFLNPQALAMFQGQLSNLQAIEQLAYPYIAAPVPFLNFPFGAARSGLAPSFATPYLLSSPAPVLSQQQQLQRAIALLSAGAGATAASGLTDASFPNEILSQDGTASSSFMISNNHDGSTSTSNSAGAAVASHTTGRPSIVIYMDCDEESLSEYQCVLRKNIELFEATIEDVQWNAQGRNKAILLRQVGLRCRHCAKLPTWSRARGAVYYSATMDGLYQAAQNMAKNHLCRHCRLLPEDTKRQLLTLRDNKRRAAGGKKYWAEGARVLGVIQTPEGLYFRDN